MTDDIHTSYSDTNRQGLVLVDGWPRLMRAEHAAAYVGEKNVHTFRRAIGTLYPRPIKVPGKGERWLKETLDQTIDKLSGKDDGPPLAELL